MSYNSNKVLKNSIFSLKTSTIFTMTVTLLSIGLVMFLTFFSNRFVQFIQEEIPFKIILKESNPHEVLELMNFLKKNEEVDIEKTLFVQKEQAVVKLKQKLGDDFLIPLNSKNPLPDIINLYIKSKFHQINTLNKLKTKIETQPIVSNVIFPTKISDNIIKLKSNILIISLIIFTTFLLLSSLLIYNNIRLTIYSEKDNLNIMQLVGATKKFIQKPYLLTSLFDGFISAIISSMILIIILFSLIYISTERYNFLTEKIFSLFSSIEIILVFTTLIFLGVFISFISHWLVLKNLLSLKINFYK